MRRRPRSRRYHDVRRKRPRHWHLWLLLPRSRCAGFVGCTDLRNHCGSRNVWQGARASCWFPRRLADQFCRAYCKDQPSSSDPARFFAAACAAFRHGERGTNSCVRATPWHRRCYGRSVAARFERPCIRSNFVVRYDHLVRTGAWARCSGAHACSYTVYSPASDQALRRAVATTSPPHFSHRKCAPDATGATHCQSASASRCFRSITRPPSRAACGARIRRAAFGLKA